VTFTPYFDDPDHGQCPLCGEDGVPRFLVQEYDAAVIARAVDEDARGDATTEIVIRPIAGIDVDLLEQEIKDHYSTGRHGMSDHACAAAIAFSYVTNWNAAEAER